MSPKVRWGLAVGLCAVGMLGALVGVLYQACQYVPPFYAAALSQDEAAAQSSSDAVLRQAAALASDIRRGRPWQALFTTEQINGWLAFDVPRNHPNLLPPEIENPRVSIEDDRMTIGFRWNRPAWSAVVSLEVEVYLREANVIAVRIRQARAGKLPLPLNGMLDSLIAAGNDLGLHIEQQQIDEDPLLLVSLPSVEAGDRDEFWLESFELRDGQVYLAGRSQRGDPALALRPEPRDETSQTDGENVNVQR